MDHIHKHEDNCLYDLQIAEITAEIMLMANTFKIIIEESAQEGVKTNSDQAGRPPAEMFSTSTSKS